MIVPPTIGAQSTGPALIAAHPGVSNVILTSTNHFCMQSHEPDFDPERGGLGFVTIAASLLSEGFDRISVANPVAKRYLDLEEDERDIVDSLRRMGGEEDGAVFGIHVNTEEYYKFASLSRIIRGAFPRAQIVGGGPHFRRDRIDGYADAVESALLMGLVDAVQIGHAQAFIDFIVKHDGRREEVTSPGFYQLDPGTGDLIGRGVGKYPDLDEVPYERIEGKSGLRTIFGGLCRNGCDFCSDAGGGGPFFSESQIINTFASVIPRMEDSLFWLYDPNPLDDRNFEFYRDVLAALDAIQPTAKNAYLDPAHLVEEERLMKTARMLWRGLFWYFFAGRDAVTEESARVLGTRYVGRLKDQGMLDGERYGLKMFIGGLKDFNSRLGGSAPYGMTISYIVTHMETRDSALAMHDDMMTFLSLADGENINIRIALSPLMPYPGTRLRRRYRDAIDLESFDFFGDGADRLFPWRADAGPGVRFMRNVALIDRADGSGSLVDGFREAIEESF